MSDEAMDIGPDQNQIELVAHSTKDRIAAVNHARHLVRTFNIISFGKGAADADWSDYQQTIINVAFGFGGMGASMPKHGSVLQEWMVAQRAIETAMAKLFSLVVGMKQVGG